MIIALSFVFSLCLCGSINSNNFERGFNSTIQLTIKYKFNYWMIVIHFMISEQEPMLRLIIVYGGHSSTNRMMVSVSILILFGDLLLIICF